MDLDAVYRLTRKNSYNASSTTTVLYERKDELEKKESEAMGDSPSTNPAMAKGLGVAAASVLNALSGTAGKQVRKKARR